MTENDLRQNLKLNINEMDVFCSTFFKGSLAGLIFLLRLWKLQIPPVGYARRLNIPSRIVTTIIQGSSLHG